MRSLLAGALALLLVMPAVATADEVLKPTKAQSALRKELRKVPQGKKDSYAKEKAIEYLKAWKASGRKPSAADGYALAQFRQSAGEPVKALEEFRAVMNNGDAKEKTRDYAATAQALLLLKPEVRDTLGKDGLAKAVGVLETWSKGMAGNPGRAKGLTKLMTQLASVHAMGGNADAAHSLRMKVIDGDIKSLGSLAGPIMQSLLGSTFAMDGYDAMRKRATEVLGTLRGKQTAVVAEKKKKLDASMAKLKAADPAALGDDGRLKKTSTRGMSKVEKAVYTDQRSYDGAKAVLDGLAKHEKPLAMLGKAAPEWTAEKAYGDVAAIGDAKGKVVLLDFWATWLDNSNIPVMRDLMKKHGEKGLVVVGLTTTAPVVYETRYDADPDLRSKWDGGRKHYAARRATEKSPADESRAIYDDAQFREIEKEAIGAFAKNHEMGWPVVLIPEDEPAAKYAAGGWPHLVLLDKQGRVRIVHAGLVSREKTDVIAKLDAAIAALLAE